MRSALPTWIGLACIALACRSSPAREPATVAVPDAGGAREVRATLDELYRAFGFAPGQGADWPALRALFADGASFVSPIAPGGAARAVGVEEFLRDFEAYVASDAVRETGLHERIVHAGIGTFGNIAHAFVAFEGFVPGTGDVRSRGLDSVQLVRDRGRWKVASFTTQYETRERAMPALFLGER